MSKDTFYFSHDYNSRNDSKVRRLVAKHGMAGYGVFWSIVEDLYNNANALQTDYDVIAYDLRVEELMVKSIVEDFNLFVIDGNTFGSSSVERRLNDRNEKSLKAKRSADLRWEKKRLEDANALQAQSDSNAIKERKGKEIKGKEKKEKETSTIVDDVEKSKNDFPTQPKKKSIEERKSEFGEKLANFKGEYSNDMLLAFYNYWTEHGDNDIKMRFEKEKTFGVTQRLATWKRIDFGNKSNNNNHGTEQRIKSGGVSFSQSEADDLQRRTRKLLGLDADDHSTNF